MYWKLEDQLWKREIIDQILDVSRCYRAWVKADSMGLETKMEFEGCFWSWQTLALFQSIILHSIKNHNINLQSLCVELSLKINMENKYLSIFPASCPLFQEYQSSSNFSSVMRSLWFQGLCTCSFQLANLAQKLLIS